MEPINTVAKFTASGISILKFIYDKITGNRDQKIHAITALQTATNMTRIFLEDNLDNPEKYKPNEKLSNAWMNAFHVVEPVDYDMAVLLRNKSKFWTNPQKWLGEPGALELVPKLRELEDYADGLLVKLNR